MPVQLPLKVSIFPKTLEETKTIFNTMSKESGIIGTYKLFNTRTFRDTLMIPLAIWLELDQEIKEKVMEAKKRAKEK